MIEGIPDGWDQERVGQIHLGEYWVNNFGQPQRWDSDHPSSSKNYVIIRKIEKPKQYRPFANAAEFLAHPLNGDFLDAGHGFYEKVTKCNDNGIYFIADLLERYDEAFCDYKFRDGTPFGIEVTE